MAKDKEDSATYAAIDIGSNAVRLLIKRMSEKDGEIRSSKEILLRVPLRLGFDVFAKGEISEKKEKNILTKEDIFVRRYPISISLISYI